MYKDLGSSTTTEYDLPTGKPPSRFGIRGVQPTKSTPQHLASIGKQPTTEDRSLKSFYAISGHVPHTGARSLVISAPLRLLSPQSKTNRPVGTFLFPLVGGLFFTTPPSTYYAEMIKALPPRDETLLERKVRELAEEAIKNGEKCPRIDGATGDTLRVAE